MIRCAARVFGEPVAQGFSRLEFYARGTRDMTSRREWLAIGF